MKIVGLITEYNPFHNGHAYHIAQAKKSTGADFCIVVMSGNFVQRGTPAILDKYARTEMALAGGADLVLELPVCYATGSAEYFASGAVTLLNHLNIVDSICFGSECHNLHALTFLAALLRKEPREYRFLLQTYLRQGEPFPVARLRALQAYLCRTETTGGISVPEMTEILSAPNNILGIEYIKALMECHSTMTPVTIRRRGSDYHEEALGNQFSSATAIRNVLEASGSTALLKSIEKEVPDTVYQILAHSYGKTYPVDGSDFSLLFQYRLLQAASANDFACYQDVTPELADRIYKLRFSFTNYEDFVTLVKTKQFTEARIRRALLHILLNIRADGIDRIASAGRHYYLRILGFRKSSAELLRDIKQQSHLPIITKLADAAAVLDAQGLSMLHQDLFAAHLYQSVVTNKYAGQPYNEYTKQLILK